MASSRTRAALFGIVVAAATVATGATNVSAATSSPNLLKNGNAEAAPGGTGQTVPVPNWKRTNGKSFTAVKYGTPGFPKTSDPAPHNPGKNFFAGGSQLTPDNQVAVQTIALSSQYVTKIKGGHVTVTAAGWFGGFGNEADTANLEVDFKNGSGALVGSSLVVGGVTAHDRNNKTGLLHRLKTMTVPKGTRSLYVQAIFDDIPCSGTCTDIADSYNNAYADNMTVVLNNV